MAIKKCLISKTISDDGHGNRSIAGTIAHIVDPVIGDPVVLNYRGPKYEGWRVLKIVDDASQEEMSRASYLDRKGWDTTPFGCMAKIPPEFHLCFAPPSEQKKPWSISFEVCDEGTPGAVKIITASGEKLWGRQIAGT